MGGTTDARIMTHSALLLLAGPPGCLATGAGIFVARQSDRGVFQLHAFILSW